MDGFTRPSVPFDTLVAQEVELVTLRDENANLKRELKESKRKYLNLLVAGEGNRRRRRKAQAELASLDAEESELSDGRSDLP